MAKIVVKSTDMEQEMLEFAFATVQGAVEKYNSEKEIAQEMKRLFEAKYFPIWHCIVGRKFSSYVTHEAKHYAYFYMGQMGVMIFKSAS